jgi:ABC-type nitrate/sulfonate/bicarbonate transport system substrate-binding protein
LAVEAKSPNLFQMTWYAVETSTHSVNALLVPKDSPLTSIRELRGKTVGTFTGATQVLNLEAIFQKSLGKSSAVNITQVAPNLQLQTLERKEVAAFFTIEPNVTIAIEKNIAKVLVDNPRCKYILDPFPAGGGVLAARFLTARPKEAQATREALNEAIAAIRANEQAVKQYLPRYSPIDPVLAPKSRLYEWWTSSEVKPESLQAVSDLLEKGKILTAHINVSHFIWHQP